jgi:hypothetical protein
METQLPFRLHLSRNRKKVLAVLLAVGMSCAGAQNPSNAGGKAISRGECAVSHSGNGDTIIIKNCGIGEEQGRKIVTLLKAVLANQNLGEVNAKLDNLLILASRPTQEQNCVGSACAQGAGSSAQYNQYGAAKLVISDEQRDQIRDAMVPYAGINVGIVCNNATEDSMAFAKQLQKALNDAGLVAGTPIAAMVLASAGGVIPAGMLVHATAGNKPAVDALGLIMQKVHVIDKPIPLGILDQQEASFQITITPNH